jgi:hypothetical protein
LSGSRAKSWILGVPGATDLVPGWSPWTRRVALAAFIFAALWIWRGHPHGDVPTLSGSGLNPGGNPLSGHKSLLRAPVLLMRTTFAAALMTGRFARSQRHSVRTAAVMSNGLAPRIAATTPAPCGLPA